MAEQTSACTHEPRYREYYRDGLYKCWECKKIIEELPRITQIPQQTAVMFLVNKLMKESTGYISLDALSSYTEQALEMEKEQIRDAYNQGDTDVVMEKPGLRSGTMYYEEKYGKDK